MRYSTASKTGQVSSSPSFTSSTPRWPNNSPANSLGTQLTSWLVIGMQAMSRAPTQRPVSLWPPPHFLGFKGL